MHQFRYQFLFIHFRPIIVLGQLLFRNIYPKFQNYFHQVILQFLQNYGSQHYDRKILEE